MRLAAERAQLADICHRLAAAGLVVASAGNVSTRVDDLVVITPRRLWLENVQPDSCIVLDLDGDVVEGGRPSSETPLHLAIYRTSAVAAVVHTHSLYATALSTIVDELPAIHYSIAVFGGSVPVCDYATFGSVELADNVVRALDGRYGALMRNHGAIATGGTLERAFEHAVLLEWLASLYHHAQSAGVPSLLSTADLEAVTAQVRALDAKPQAQ
jgi:L-fuculose-phosphate aldolase